MIAKGKLQHSIENHSMIATTAAKAEYWWKLFT